MAKVEVVEVTAHGAYGTYLRTSRGNLISVSEAVASTFRWLLRVDRGRMETFEHGCCPDEPGSMGEPEDEWRTSDPTEDFFTLMARARADGLDAGQAATVAMRLLGY